MLNPIQELQQGFEFRSVLIIDDDPTLTESLSRILRMFFKECVTASDGEEGYALFLERFKASNPFTLIITDLELPKKGGLGVIKEIRTHSKTQPILILSAHDESSFMAEAINFDIQGYLLKPLAMPKLFDSLEKVFAIKEVDSSLSVALSDPLTGWKRLLLLEQTLQNKEIPLFTMMYIRVNYFTNIYTLIGKDYADEYLKELSVVMKSLLTDQGGTFYRCSEDEFCLLFEEKKLSYAEVLSNDMVSVARYFNISGRGIILNSTLSIAIVVGKEDIIVNAKRALETLQNISAGGVVIYKDENFEKYPLVADGQNVLKLIFNALENESVIPFFQSILNAKTQKIEIYASLIRIRGDSNKIYGPETFLKIAVDTHQMTMLTRAIIRNTLDYGRMLDPDSLISINLSGNDLNDDGLIPYIMFCLEKYSISTQRVAFEIVDGVKFITSECSLLTIKTLQSKGFKIIINDFGSKLCDISLFLAIRPDYIKLHTDLIRKLEGDPHFLFIIHKFVEIIHFIGAKAIIKHLSNTHLVQLCTSSGVDCLQGYAIGLPFEVTREE